VSLRSPVELLNRAAEASPETVAYVCGDDHLTYAEALGIARGLSDELRGQGAEGRAVVLVLPNGLPVCLYSFAVQAAGGMLCTANPAYTARELALVLGDAEPAAVICMPEGAAVVREALPDGSDAAVTVLPEDVSAWLAARPRDPRPLPVPDAHAVGTLQYTGGTTGRPKGVMLTNGAVVRNIEQREAALPTDAGDERVLCVMPLFHVFAQAMCLHLAAMARGTLHVLPRYRPDWTLDALERERITRFPAGPTVFNGLTAFEGFEDRDWSRLRCAYSGSAPLSVATLKRWEAATGALIYEGYGQTEAGPILTFNGPRFPARPGTVGRPVEGTQIRLMALGDPTREAEPGEPGEIAARGPQVMSGYKGLPEETERTLMDGWLHTGDVGRFDEAGYLVIEDRKKDLVLVGGFNVYPREVDEVLMAHDAVAEAAVVGVPDAYRGERLVAHVVLREGAACGEGELARHCEAMLVRYKRPAAYVFERALPRTPAQKIDKKALREGHVADVA
jgi:long-chain acyl-CoA synthetase